ncbi:MAG: family permease [Actinomycetia bacterium]|nr:family permease [Actinomycetes bacterium]
MSTPNLRQPGPGADARSSPGTSPSGEGGERLPLSRSLKTLETIALTVAAVAPTAGVFIIIPVALVATGTGTFYTFLLGAVIAVCVGFCYAELGVAFPYAGGEYSIAGRVVGRPVGFVTLVMWMIQIIFGLSAISLGAASYLSGIWHLNPNMFGAILAALATLISIFRVNRGAKVTVLFMVIELACLAIIAVLGFSHVHNGASALFSPHLFSASGHTTPVGIGTIVAGISFSLYTYNGYGSAVYFSEELKGGRRQVGRVVLLSLFVVVLVTLIPVIAILLGAPSLSAMSNSASPMTYFVTALSNKTVNTVIGVMVVLSVFNAVIAGIMAFARILYSSGRDNAWPQPISRWLGSVHSKSRVPVVATLVLGVPIIVLTAASNLAEVVTFTGVLVTIVYVVVTLSAIASRWRKIPGSREYRMPLWPLAPLLALAATIYVMTQQTGANLKITGWIVLGSLLYFVIYLRSKRTGRWTLDDAPPDTPDEE